MQKGLIHVYTGGGKGKTTAAVGLAIRACGAGKRVCIVSFLKTSPSGEIEFINSLSNCRLRVFRFESEHGFVSCEDKEKIRPEIEMALKFIFDALENNECDVLVLDEILCAYNLGCVSEDEIRRIIGAKTPECELVLTGRGAPDWLIELADYVTEMRAVKHPYTLGTEARRGIEY